jgi:hypothetical protein
MPADRRATAPKPQESDLSLHARAQPAARVFYTLQQIADRHPAFTLRTLRHWIYNSKDRMAWKGGKPTVIPGNGFARAMIKVGQRIYIDEPALLEWLEEAQR